MSSLLASALALALSAAGPPASPADSAPKSAPQPAPPPAPPAEKASPALFEAALKQYFDRDPKGAAAKLYRFIEGTPPTDENYAWAQLFLGKSLTDLGLHHAGAVYLAQVARERTNPAALPRALEELLKETDRPHDEVMIDEQVFGVLDLAFLPPETSSFAHYYQGLLDLRVGNERWAKTHFSKLPPESAEASKAKFAVLVTRLKGAKSELPREMEDQFLELFGDNKLSQQTRNEAILAVARLRYERGEYTGALEAYHQVKLPALDPFRATLYLEEAWTLYRLGQVHAAMGILTTLDAPSFRDEFLPDKYILRASVYRDLCHYLPAKRAAKELTRRFADSLEAIREREDLTLDTRLRRAAVSHGATERAEKFLEVLNLEGERLGRYAGSFGPRLFGHLSRVYALALGEAKRVYELRLQEGVRVEADTLLKAAEQVRLMEYEVGLKLYERVKAGARAVVAPEEEAMSPDQVAFRFNGEYWNDELRDYRFSLKNRCIEEGAR